MPEGERADMKKPRLLRVAVVLSPVILAVLAFGVLWLLGEPWVFSTNGEMDINSGDMRARACLFGVPIKSRIHESSLSEEIRTLGIAIPATREFGDVRGRTASCRGPSLTPSIVACS